MANFNSLKQGMFPFDVAYIKCFHILNDNFGFSGNDSQFHASIKTGLVEHIINIIVDCMVIKGAGVQQFPSSFFPEVNSLSTSICRLVNTSEGILPNRTMGFQLGEKDINKARAEYVIVIVIVIALAHVLYCTKLLLENRVSDIDESCNS